MGVSDKIGVLYNDTQENSMVNKRIDKLSWEDNGRAQGYFILLYYYGSILEQTKGVN